METNMLAETAWQWVVAFLFVLVCLLLILVVLLQKGRGGGLSGAFGGVGGHTAFGAKTGDVFTWITVGLTFLFILSAVIGNYTFVPRKITDDTAQLKSTTDDGGTPPAEVPGESGGPASEQG